MTAVNIPIGFKRISEKHCSETVFEGIITAMNGKTAILETQIPIGMFENISLCADNDVFCKVIGEAKQGFLLRFTAGNTDFCKRFMEAGSI